jgi:hypothetical protein
MQVPDDLHKLLALYDAMQVETGKEEGNRMRCEIAELLAERWIETMVLHDDTHRVVIDFKFRPPTIPQDRLVITFTGPSDPVGSVEYGRYDPVTQHFRKLEPNEIDLAYAHAAIVTNDPGFEWSETWTPPKVEKVEYVEWWKPGWRQRLQTG